MIGVLVMAYGGPNNLDEAEPYLMDVRGYQPAAISTNIHLERIEMLNTASEMIDGLAGLVPEKAEESG